MMTVYLSDTAKNQLHHIIDYLEERWSVQVRNNFLDKLQRSMDLLARIPYGFPESTTYPGLRKHIITPQTTAYYRVNNSEQEVEIVAVIDSRSDFAG